MLWKALTFCFVYLVGVEISFSVGGYNKVSLNTKTRPYLDMIVETRKLVHGHRYPQPYPHLSTGLICLCQIVNPYHLINIFQHIYYDWYKPFLNNHEDNANSSIKLPYLC